MLLCCKWNSCSDIPRGFTWEGEFQIFRQQCHQGSARAMTRLYFALKCPLCWSQISDTSCQFKAKKDFSWKQNFRTHCWRKRFWPKSVNYNNIILSFYPIVTASSTSPSPSPPSLSSLPSSPQPSSSSSSPPQLPSSWLWRDFYQTENCDRLCAGPHWESTAAGGEERHPDDHGKYQGNHDGHYYGFVLGSGGHIFFYFHKKNNVCNNLKLYFEKNEIVCCVT